MKLKHLHLKKMPNSQQDGPQLRNLVPGINIIYGANGSGKTTLFRGLQLLMTDNLNKTNDNNHLQLEASWEDNGKLLEEQLDCGVRTWSYAGNSINNPVLPSILEVGAYTLSIEDLFHGNETDTAFLEKAATELHAGYDLATLFPKKKRQLKLARLITKLTTLRAEIREARLQQKELQYKMDHLENLQTLEEKTNTARDKIILLPEARQRLELQQNIIASEQLKGGFPTYIARWLNIDLEHIAKLAKQEKQFTNKLIILQKNIQQEELKLNKSPFINCNKPALQLKNIDSLLDKNSALQYQIDDYKKKYAIKSHATIDKTRDIKEDDLKQLQRIFKKKQELDYEIGSLQTKANAFEIFAKTKLKDDQHTTLANLEAWLSAPRANPWIYTGIILILIALILFFSNTTNHHWGSIGALLIALLNIAHGTTLYKKTQNIKNDCAKLTSDILLWTNSAISKKCQDLRNQQAEQRSSQNGRMIYNQCMTDLKRPQRELALLEMERTNLTKQLCFEPDISSLGQVLNLQHLLAQKVKYQEAIDAKYELEHLQQEQDNLLQRINKIFTMLKQSKAESFTEAKSILDELRKQWQIFSDSKQQMRALEREERQQNELLQQAKNEFTQLSNKLSIDLRDSQLLESYTKALPLFRKWYEDHNQLTTKLTLQSEKLKCQPELLVDSSARLDILEQQWDEDSASWEKAIKDRQKMQTTIDHFQNGHVLGQLLQQEEQLIAQADEYRKEVQQHEVRRCILDQLHESFEKGAQPELIAKATDLFKRFTFNRYKLQVYQNKNYCKFNIKDLLHDEWLQQDQLSRGTKMQLLLAIRIANALLSNHVGEIPFVLDEPFSHADPERLQALASCFCELAKDGQQIICFTTRNEEIEIWQNEIKKHNITNSKITTITQS